MTAILTNGSKFHTHSVNFFHQDPGTVAELHTNNSGLIKGTVNIGLDKKLDEWPKVPVTIQL
jgi:hypothetical protein